ncbi:MAG: FGGY-family carbohydrate kinase [Sphaerochaetaceae bacterium]
MIIVLDIGTSNVRAVLINAEGKLVLVQTKAYALSIPSTYAVEMDMTVFEHAVWDVLTAVTSYAITHAIDIEAISITSQRSSIIAVDADGVPLGPALMWQDTRAQYICDRQTSQLEKIYALTGMRPSPVFSAPKMQFLKEQHPELYAQSSKLIGFCEFTLHLLTQQFATDYSIASRTCLFDITNLQWSEYLLERFSIDEKKLCPLVEVGSIIGFTTERITEKLGLGSAIPVISAGGDQQCAALGLGCLHPGEYMLNEGSGMYAIGISDSPVFDEQMSVNCNLSATAGKYIVEGAVLSAGKTMDWLNALLFASPEETHPYERFTVASRKAAPGAHGLRFSVQLAGKGTPVWDPFTRGALLNLSLIHTKEDIARALFEGLGVAAKECLDRVAQVNGTPINKVKISGGLTNDSFFNQIQTDFFQKPVERYLLGQATTLGAWISASTTLGTTVSHEACFQALESNLRKEIYIPSPTNRARNQQIEKEILLYENTNHRRYTYE